MFTAINSMPPSFSHAGKMRRLARIFSSETGRTIIAPIDDALIAGPTAGLERPEAKLALILAERPNATITFPSVLRNQSNLFNHVGTIANLTASTKLANHTRKVMIGSVHQAVQLNADAVAVHVNISSRYESEMLKILGQIARDCDRSGMPLLAIMYPRKENGDEDENYEILREKDPTKYTELIAHCVRVGVELGADIIKTHYTGNVQTFRQVVDAAGGIPIVVSGGPIMPVERLLRETYDIMMAGAAGVSFGRNIFGRACPEPVLSALKAIVHQGVMPSDYLAGLSADELENIV